MEPSDLLDLEEFLKDVEQKCELVEELNSADVSIREKAVEKADLVLSSKEEKACKTPVDRTVINESISCDTGHESNFDAELFMKALEYDAEERRKKRREKEKKANALKEQGNKAFACGEYEAAVNAYSEGLQELRDMQALYTNRAQAFIKLNRFKEAIQDCQWALKCNDKCVKAYVHMGRAHLALKNFTESRQCYETILTIAPEHENMVKDYLTEVDLEEKKTVQEKIAYQKLNEENEGVTRVTDLLTKLAKSNELILYNCGGVRLLTEAITDSSAQTVFRLSNGFTIISDNKSVRRCLAFPSKSLYSEELCVAVLELWRTVCAENEENQQLLLQCPNVRELLVNLLTSKSSAIQQECLNLLCMYSQTPHGRRLIIEKLNLPQMVANLMDYVSRDDPSRALALSILQNLAGEHKFRSKFRETFTIVLAPTFEKLLEQMSESRSSLLDSLISVLWTMCLDEVIRSKMSGREEFWKSSFTAMCHCASSEYRSILYPLLGLMISVASNPSAVIQDEDAVVGCHTCMTLLSNPDGGVITRAVGLLSVVLPKSKAAIHEVVQQGVVKKLLKILKGTGQTSLQYSIKALAVCTASCQKACEELVNLDKRLVTMRQLLGSSDELVVGNAALCLGHCLAEQGAAASLLGTDCVQLLLQHVAGKAERPCVQKNCAIALGKLCKVEPRHLVKLRELHGLEILHSCMKLI